MTRTFLLAALALGLQANHLLAQGKAVSAQSPDGKRLATADKKDVKVADVATGKVLLAFRGHKADVTALAWSPDGKMLASADGDGEVRLLDGPTGRLLWSRKANQGVNKLAVSADGKTLTASAPGASRKFDLATGKEVP